MGLCARTTGSVAQVFRQFCRSSVHFTSDETARIGRKHFDLYVSAFNVSACEFVVFRRGKLRISAFEPETDSPNRKHDATPHTESVAIVLNIAKTRKNFQQQRKSTASVF